MSRRRVKSLILGVLLSVVLIGAALAYIAWRLSWQSPQWYTPPNPSDPVVAALADDAEYDVLQKTQLLRPEEETWTLRLSEDEVNAWLAARLPQWIEHDAEMKWPEALGTPQVLFEPSSIRVAVPLRSGDTERTIVGTLEPSITPEGQIALRLSNIAMGRVWVPGKPLSRLMDALRSAAPEFLQDARVQQAADILAGDATLSPELDLADGRRVIIRQLLLADGHVEFTAVTRLDDSP